MWCFVLTIMFVLPAFSVAQDPKENKTKISCDKPDVTSAGDKFFQCFSDTIEHSLNKNNRTCDTLDQDIKAYMKVANESCYNDTSSNVDAENFLKLVQFSIKNGQFAEFVNNGGVNCILWAKNGMSECVMQEVVPTPESSKKSQLSRYDTLWSMTTLTIDQESCTKALKIKLCVQEQLWNCANSEKETLVLYVSSLFEFMLGRCSWRVPEWSLWITEEQLAEEPKFKPFNNTGNRTTHALLGVLLTLAILSIFYVCIRDCRASRGQWKALNDRISMSVLNKRRRSLVENEVQENHA